MQPEIEAALTYLYEKRMADAVTHRETAQRHRREGNERKAEKHMNTAHAFRNIALGVAEAHEAITRLEEA